MILRLFPRVFGLGLVASLAAASYGEAIAVDYVKMVRDGEISRDVPEALLNWRSENQDPNVFLAFKEFRRDIITDITRLSDKLRGQSLGGPRRGLSPLKALPEPKLNRIVLNVLHEKGHIKTLGEDVAFMGMMLLHSGKIRWMQRGAATEYEAALGQLRFDNDTIYAVNCAEFVLLSAHMAGLPPRATSSGYRDSRVTSNIRSTLGGEAVLVDFHETGLGSLAPYWTPAIHEGAQDKAKVIKTYEDVRDLTPGALVVLFARDNIDRTVGSSRFYHIELVVDLQSDKTNTLSVGNPGRVKTMKPFSWAERFDRSSEEFKHSYIRFMRNIRRLAGGDTGETFDGYSIVIYNFLGSDVLSEADNPIGKQLAMDL